MTKKLTDEVKDIRSMVREGKKRRANIAKAENRMANITEKCIEAGFTPINSDTGKPSRAYTHINPKGGLLYTAYFHHETDIVKFSNALNVRILAWEHMRSFSGRRGASVKGYLWARFDYHTSDYEKKFGAK